MVADSMKKHIDTKYKQFTLFCSSHSWKFYLVWRVGDTFKELLLCLITANLLVKGPNVDLYHTPPSLFQYDKNPSQI